MERKEIKINGVKCAAVKQPTGSWALYVIGKRHAVAWARPTGNGWWSMHTLDRQILWTALADAVGITGATGKNPINLFAFEIAARVR